MKKDFLFVCGTGRCGKSIIAHTIARHPGVAHLEFDLRFITDPDGILDFYSSYSSTWSYYFCDKRLKRLENFLNEMVRKPSLLHCWLGRVIQIIDPHGFFVAPKAYWEWELDRHLPNFGLYSKWLIDRLVDFTFPACWFGTESYEWKPTLYHAPPMHKEKLAQILGDFLRTVFGALLDKTGKQLFVEDTRDTMQLAKELLELLPEAKIVHVIRDPRDVIASYVTRRWCPKDKVQAAHIYRVMMEHWWNDVRSHLPANSYMEIRFEDLVMDNETAMRQICDFCGLPFHISVVRDDLTDHHIGRWKREYTQGEKIRVQSILGDIIQELGYRQME